MHLAINFLYSAGPNCLNRGEDNRPKTTWLGQWERFEASPYCFKRMLRQALTTAGLLPKIEAASHSRNWPQQVRDQLARHGVPNPDAVAALYFLGATEKNYCRVLPTGDQVETLLTTDHFLSERQCNDMVAACLEKKDALSQYVKPFRETVTASVKGSKAEGNNLAKKVTSDLIKALFAKKARSSGVWKEIGNIHKRIIESDDSLFQILFGTMNVSVNHCRDGILYVQPLVSVNAANELREIFTVKDDLRVKREEDAKAEEGEEEDSEQGAANMGTTYSASGVYHGYLSVNLIETLKAIKDRHGEAAPEMTVKAVGALIEGLVRMQPTAKINNYGNSRQPPSWILVELTDEPLSYLNAFEVPIGAGDVQGVTDQAIARIDDYIKKMDSFRQGLFVQKWKKEVSLGNGSLAELIKETKEQVANVLAEAKTETVQK